MRKFKKTLSLILVVCMVLGMLPAFSISAAAAEPGNFMVVSDVGLSSGGSWWGGGDKRYMTTVNSNAFNVFMYDNTFSGTFGDQHMGGIELSLNGMRIATNGDLHLLPTPEQWDATPAPSKGTAAICHWLMPSKRILRICL